MTKSYSINILSTSFFFFFFLISSCSGISQNDTTAILEEYRLKLIGTTINLLAKNDSINTEEITSDNIITHMRKTRWPKNDTVLILALLNTTQYESKNVPKIDSVADIKIFYDFIFDNLSGKQKKKPKFSEFKKDCMRLIGACHETIIGLSKSSNVPVPVLVPKESNIDTPPPTLPENEFNLWKVFTIANLILFFILAGLFFLGRKNQKKELKVITKSIIENERRLSNKILANTDPQQGKIISTLQTRITKAERDLMLLKTKIDRQQITKTPSTPSMPTRVEKPVYTPPPIIKKYTEFPDTPNGFKVVSLSDTETANSRYEITFQNDTSATFIFKASQNATEYAINNSQMILRNACDYNNMPNEGKKIKTETQGRLTKEGGIWRILSKAKIRFYN